MSTTTRKEILTQRLNQNRETLKALHHQEIVLQKNIQTTLLSILHCRRELMNLDREERL